MVQVGAYCYDKASGTFCMAEHHRICESPNGSTIDALGHGKYRVCDKNSRCSDVEGLYQAYQTLRVQEKTMQ
ncbi:MAG: hypothetical protein CL862_13665 [Cyanobium sp. NAT70]|nr:hypothetical protein [Cyanobium sp. NAT70]